MSIKADVDRGVAIHEEIEKLSAELKLIDARLKEAALNGEQVELNDAERTGRQFLANGTGRIVPVILTSDHIVSEFGGNTEKRDLIAAASLGHFGVFFKLVNKYENRFESGKKFRARAGELMGADAPAFITACIARDKSGIPKSVVKVCWGESKAK